MKSITTLFFAFIAASFVYARDIAYENCQKELSKYNECLGSGGNTLEQICLDTQSEKCQQFYDNPFSYVPICKEDIVNSKLLHPILMAYVNQRMQLACQKDEAGNSCPFSDTVLNERFKKLNYYDEEEIKKAKESTCKSKICRDVTHRAYANIQVVRNYYDEKIALGHIRKEEAALKEEIAKYLESEECMAMSGDVKQENANNLGSEENKANNNNNNAKQNNPSENNKANNNNDAKQNNSSDNNKTISGASTFKPVIGIFITLGLLLLSHY